jgi:hypothetical protein
MKIKKLKNVIRDVIKSSNKFSSEKEDETSCKYDPDLSSNFFDFISKIVKLEEGLDINFFDDFVSLTIDFFKIKRNGKNGDEVFTFEIDKRGFSLRLNSSSFYYLDSDFYEKVKPILLEKHEIIAKETLKKSIDDILNHTGLVRNIKLEKLLNS